jgi:hypothetical protein
VQIILYDDMNMPRVIMKHIEIEGLVSAKLAHQFGDDPLGSRTRRAFLNSGPRVLELVFGHRALHRSRAVRAIDHPD